MRSRGAFTKWVAALGAAVFVAACSDDPSAPPLPVATVLEARGPGAQSATVGQAVTTAPAVLVRDDAGAPMPGVEVRFEIMAGGGVLETPVDTSGADGVASAGRWTLGPTPGGNEVVARSGTLTPVVFAATALARPRDYRIDVQYLVPVSARQAQAVDDAIARWESAILGDLPAIPVAAAAGSCFDTQPALNETIDDLLIFIEFVDIDGVGRILGEAGPCYIRSGDRLPVVGHLKLDRADLATMEGNGTIDDVVLHEIGHVLGIGTLWDLKGLTSGTGGTDPRFTGARAAAAYGALGGAEPDVPVENTGGAGTRDSHWRESVFGSELMTGFIGSTPNPLSALTIGSLTDLGYGVDASVASSYSLGAVRGLALKSVIDLGAAERVKGPKFEIDPQGRRIRYH